MFVRVQEKENKRYYKSVVYGIVECDYKERYIVYHPFLEVFECVDYLMDGTDRLAVSRISSDQEGWVTYNRVQLLKFKKFCKEQESGCSIESFSGYEDVVNNHDFLLKVVEGQQKVKASNETPMIRELHDAKEWNYIRTQQDANEFMSLFAGFHDSTMKSMQYAESLEERKLTVTFDNSGWYGVVELCFEGLLSMNLRPALESYLNYIYSACLIVEEDLSIFWADDYMEKVDLSYEGSYIKALNLKWKKIK